MKHKTTNTMKHKTTNTLFICATALALPISTQAAVTFVGSLQEDFGSQISSWSSASVTKTQDIDNNGYYGSDGYAWMNSVSLDGGAVEVLTGVAESVPAYFNSSIAYSGSGTGVSGSFSGAADRLLPDGTGSANVGYAGPNYAHTTGATVLQQMFAYTMNRNMSVGETIRVGVVLDSLNGTVIGADQLRLVAGDGFADATGISRSGVMDMYFFDVTGLTSGQQIQIWGAKNADVIWPDNVVYNAITIGGVTFDSIPEPATALLGGIGLLALLRRRR